MKVHFVLLSLYFVIFNSQNAIIHGFTLSQSHVNYRAVGNKRRLINEARMSIQYPQTIKNVISRLTAATQKSLQSQKSRIEIELPPGAEYGVETGSQRTLKKSKTESGYDALERSNREAARLITEMFSIIASTTVVLFPTEAEAAVARNLWGSKFKGGVLAIDVSPPKGYGKLQSRRFSIKEQEQALLASNDGVYVPAGTEVLIVAGPRPKDLKKVLKLHEKFGDGTLLILLNARLSTLLLGVNDSAGSNTGKEHNRWVPYAERCAQIFENVFHYAPPVMQQ